MNVMVKIFGEEGANDIIKRYLNSEPIISISKDYGKSHECIRYHLKKAGVFTTQRKSYTINDSYFNVLDSEDKLYTLGFLYADGYVSMKDNRFGFKLSSIDKHILDTFKINMNATAPVITREERVTWIRTLEGKKYFTSKETANFTVGSKDMVQSLIGYNLTSTKTYHTNIPDILSTSPHFWRGMIDGDGCLYYKDKKVQLTLVGTLDVCTKFLEFVKSIHPSVRAKVLLMGKIYRVTVGSAIALAVLDVCYGKSTIHLNRKYAKYLNIKTTFTPKPRVFKHLHIEIE